MSPNCGNRERRRRGEKGRSCRFFPEAPSSAISSNYSDSQISRTESLFKFSKCMTSRLSLFCVIVVVFILIPFPSLLYSLLPSLLSDYKSLPPSFPTHILLLYLAFVNEKFSLAFPHLFCSSSLQSLSSPSPYFSFSLSLCKCTCPKSIFNHQRLGIKPIQLYFECPRIVPARNEAPLFALHTCEETHHPTFSSSPQHQHRRLGSRSVSLQDGISSSSCSNIWITIFLFNSTSRNFRLKIVD